MYYPGYECSEQDNGMYACESNYWSGSDCYMWYGNPYCANWDYNYVYTSGYDYYYDEQMYYPGYECTDMGNGYYSCESE